MKLRNSLLIWLPLLILIIFIYPKPCGSLNNTDSIYTCYGFKTPYISSYNSNVSDFCSGFCKIKDKNITKNNTISSASDDTPVSGIAQNFAKAMPALLLIFIIIGIISWISSLKNKGSTEIRVYKN